MTSAAGPPGGPSSGETSSAGSAPGGPAPAGSVPGPGGRTGFAARGHIAGLDGMRALSVIAVLFYHLDLLPGGYVGVDVFFVLSGFLITGLLLSEWNTAGGVSLRAFYVRRAFRLLPAFYAYAACGVLFVLAVGGDNGLREYLRGLVSSVFAANNWYRVFDLDGGGVWFGQTWSLSVEDQFYFAWPALLLGLLAVQRRWPRVTVGIMIIGAIATVTIRQSALVLLGADGPRIYLGLDTRADSLLVGAALAVWFDRAARTPAGPAAALLPSGPSGPTGPVGGPAADASAGGRAGRAWLWCGRFGIVGGAGLAVFALFGPEAGPPSPTWMAWGGYTLIALLAGMIIVGVVGGAGPRPWRGLLSSRPMVHLGRVSYAFYLWHFPVCDVVQEHARPRLGAVGAVVLAFGATYLLAWLSAVLVERPAARRRPRWADVGARTRDAAPAIVRQRTAPTSPATGSRTG